jgi:hypothetical protein
MRHRRLDIPGYAFPLQFWPQVAAAKLRVTEIPVRLIYNDPNRHFGGALDEADNRLKHYLMVLCGEMKRLSENPLTAWNPGASANIITEPAGVSSQPRHATADSFCCCMTE